MMFKTTDSNFARSPTLPDPSPPPLGRKALLRAGSGALLGRIVIAIGALVIAMALPLRALICNPLITLVKKLATAIMHVFGLVRQILVPSGTTELGISVKRSNCGVSLDVPGLPPWATKKGGGVIHTRRSLRFLLPLVEPPGLCDDVLHAPTFRVVF